MQDKEIILSADQEQALTLLLDFILHSEKQAFTLIGNAGTGKTTVVNKLLKALEANHFTQYVLCAPTHKAKFVLGRATKREAITLHKLLKLSPNLDVMRLDLRQLSFITTMEVFPEVPFKGVVICDEASMINDVLFDTLLNACKGRGAKVLFIGDKAQISPIDEYKISKVFDLDNQFELTFNHRQSADNALVPLIDLARHQILTDFQAAKAPLGSLYLYHSAAELLEANKSDFEQLIATQDVFRCKILSYTNKRVAQFNQAVRQMLYPDSQETEYHLNEILMCYDNLEYNCHPFFNSSDYIVLNIEKMTKTLPEFGEIDGFNLTLRDTIYDNTATIFVITRQVDVTDLDRLTRLIDRYQSNAICCTKGTKEYRLAWRKYFDLVNSFACPMNLELDSRLVKTKTFDYGYAITIHKIQGSSLEKVFFDNKSLIACKDPNEYRQLQYVALSRTQTDLHVLI
ncbi:RecD-like DNA helicase YrrC [Candidatus Symbiothrix dinenymphae]|nr:RecD-like DNA helicase YrrC [Candidatus Symbiothrix dinenymphae]